jgi:hypothetical protein
MVKNGDQQYYENLLQSCNQNLDRVSQGEDTFNTGYPDYKQEHNDDEQRAHWGSVKRFAAGKLAEIKE